MKASLIVAYDSHRGIGISNRLPWRLSQDLSYFKHLTTTTEDPLKHNAVIMGRRTWESLPPSFRPLPLRVNAVLSRSSIEVPHSVLTFSSLETAIDALSISDLIESVFIIGGATVYQEALSKNLIHTIYATEIHAEFPCDAFFPALPENFLTSTTSSLYTENQISFLFKKFIAAPKP